METIDFNGKAVPIERWYKICDAGAGRPVPMAEWDASRSCVYHREYGVFPVSFGRHQQVMALLYAWHHGYEDAYDMKEAKGIRELSTLADKFLEEIEGTAFKSSVGKCAVAGNPRMLTVFEKRYFGVLKYLDE